VERTRGIALALSFLLPYLPGETERKMRLNSFSSWLGFSLGAPRSYPPGVQRCTQGQANTRCHEHKSSSVSCDQECSTTDSGKRNAERDCQEQADGNCSLASFKDKSASQGGSEDSPKCVQEDILVHSFEIVLC